jgi:chromosome segregation ATPase
MGKSIKVGPRYIPILDLSEDFKAKLYPRMLTEKRANYIRHNYYVPKQAFSKELLRMYEKKIFSEYAFIFNPNLSRWQHIEDYTKFKIKKLKTMYNSMSTIRNMINEYRLKIDRIKEDYNSVAFRLKNLRTKKASMGKIIRLNAYIVGATEIDNIYEIAEMEYSSYYKKNMPSSRHAFLKTVGTNYISKGYFSMDVVIVTTIPVKLKEEYGSFKQKWTLYKEVGYDDRKLYRDIRDYQLEYNNLREKMSDLQNKISTLKKKLKKYVRNLKKYHTVSYE